MKRNETGIKRDCSRSNRMYMDDSGWYFRTREGHSVGPFRDELEASTQLEVYIRLLEVGLLQAVNAQPMEQIKKKRAG
ncbi:MAG: DUF6316 family protein [Halioglobus sp.]